MPQKAFPNPRSLVSVKVTVEVVEPSGYRRDRRAKAPLELAADEATPAVSAYSVDEA